MKKIQELTNGQLLLINDNFYTVKTDYLQCEQGGNDKILSQIWEKLDPEIRDSLSHDYDTWKKKLMEEGYGYLPGYGMWPEAHWEDYPALTRLLNLLIERYQVEVLLPHTQELSLGDYDATVFSHILVVGCQKIPFEKVEELYKLMLNLKEKDNADKRDGSGNGHPN